MLFSDGAIFITLSYAASAALILGLIGQTIWRARATKKQADKLTRQYESLISRQKGNAE